MGTEASVKPAAHLHRDRRRTGRLDRVGLLAEFPCDTEVPAARTKPADGVSIQLSEGLRFQQVCHPDRGTDLSFSRMAA